MLLRYFIIQKSFSTYTVVPVVHFAYIAFHVTCNAHSTVLNITGISRIAKNALLDFFPQAKLKNPFFCFSFIPTQCQEDSKRIFFLFLCQKGPFRARLRRVILYENTTCVDALSRVDVTPHF